MRSSLDRNAARLAAAFALAAGAVPAHALPTFTDVTNALNLGDTGHRHFGITIVDLNDDGFVDLYYANGLQDPLVSPLPPTGTCPNPPGFFPPENTNTLYMNNGDGTFSGDIAPQVGLDDKWNAMRNVFGDYDNDGDRDMISHNFLQSPLYKNVGAADSLAYVDASSETETDICLRNGTGASWVDLNHDGYLDLYGCEYDFARAADQHIAKMFLNDGDGTFSEVTSLAGVDLVDNGMGISFCDYDNDGDQDFFMTNSHEAPTRLYRHDGMQGGVPVFSDVAVEAGVAVQDSLHRGVGIGWGDYNNDGRFDMLFSREGDSRLWRNDGPNGSNVWTFSDMSTTGGLSWKFLPQPYGMWGGNFLDLDNDGWLDIIVANRDEGAGKVNQVYMNNADGTWTEVAATLGLDRGTMAQMGVVGADYDNDGDLDLFLCSHRFGQPNSVFRNDTSPANSWIQFRLTGTVSNRDAVGARIVVTADLQPGQPETQMREVFAGTGFFSDFPRIQTFGLGTATQVTSATIYWPSGIVQPLGPLAVNARHDFTESAPVSAPLTGLPAGTSVLEAVSPNPFRSTAGIAFRLHGEAEVELNVHSVTGRLLRKLVDRRLPAGRHETVWDGRDRAGNDVGAGVYFVRLRADDIAETRKVNVLR